MRDRLVLLTMVSVIALDVPSSLAQETVGSPGATTTIEGNQLPAPQPKFGGMIKDDALSSTPWWAQDFALTRRPWRIG